MGFMVRDPNNDREHQIDVIPEKGQEYQAVRFFGKDPSIMNGIVGLYLVVLLCINRGARCSDCTTMHTRA
jgi:hypothetical protein